MAQEFSTTRLVPDAKGVIRLPEKPGLGIEPDVRALEKYLVPVEIRVGEKVVFKSGRFS